MKLPTIEFPFTLLTPAMIGGAEGATTSAEMRVSSIRGQVRWWHRKAVLSPECRQVWGQTEPSVIASRVSLSLLPSTKHAHQKVPILPHKHGGFRDGLLPPSSETLILRRLVGCGSSEWETAQKAVKLWLLLGGIGLRVNRAAGSVWPEGDWVPTNERELGNRLRDLGYRMEVRLAGPTLGTTPLELRKAASDTVSKAQYFGGISPRKPSPLKMKVVRLGSDHRLLLTGLDSANMDAAKRALGNKELGQANWSAL